MSTPYFNYGLNGFNGMDSLTNQYLMAAMMAPNVNFKGAQTDSTQAVSQTQTANNDGGIPVVAPSTQQASSGGSNFVTGALATAVIGGGALWMLKSGKFSQASKALKSLVGKGGSEATTSLTRMRAIKNGSGELKIQVPNKVKTFAGTHVEEGAAEYGIKPAIDNARRVFDPKTSQLRGFQVNTDIGRYTVFMKDGQISRIAEGTKDVTEEFAKAEANTVNNELLERFKNIASELGKESKEVDKAVLKDVVNIGYVNKNGDDALKLTMAKYDKTPQLKAFRTLEQFDRTNPAVGAYVPSSAEEVFAGDLVSQTGGWFNKKGILVDGVSVLRCEENIAGAKCFFEGDKLVKIKIGGVEYPSESFRFKDFVKANEKAIDKFKQDVFTDRLADKIPTGAIIGTV